MNLMNRIEIKRHGAHRSQADENRLHLNRKKGRKTTDWNKELCENWARKAVEMHIS